MDAHNLILGRVARLCDAVATAGGDFAIENPEDLGEEPFPSIFLAPPLCDLREQWKATDVCFDQCEYGLEHRKPTRVLSSAAVSWRLRRRCSHGWGAHDPLVGKDAGGAFRTTAQSR